MKIGIIICDRYRKCAGGKCFRAMQNREGAFDIYDKRKPIDIVGYTSCGGCPGGNIEYAPEEMIKNGAETIHFVTGLVVGYPPCPYIKEFKSYIEKRFKIKVVIGTHPIPQKYYLMHNILKTWKSNEWKKLIKPTLSTEAIRKSYD
ncbi:CGGC domain-containing protein [Candidatus Gottesmanbacteria bacterium CG11_big_fil_rev_8_21_14_0_20_37_11]|uniref:CGGC domain-containing protein n=3 Tax=Candidatus Gottesmaniibacteriota TaxID=1752720 RepID=A0A2M7RSH5_9BACT|nr:MAG: CGGC domain-containing protein [Candidatus Gottesmanbacteria bacterium CG1_02_37_22]PIP32873.1 MAG: CGGC domain-containing protein [Candidatus Gottesmanbacteria bacterium CG23_combo_of_CG06-09_8_20_14_all_37_19]PIR08316.1 MAG: CGGC domain-containing protein [Candidatus Gottesmanbacteria bacterium CG11_big_fil_rev_8_21_14_0_20_37_11]PIZ02989.1 MAG: CGGC domain-containing protein [Candidatus Gottesmanbacteria bacterium CG_4_10_14_0_8_um_filter_37_24]